MFEKVTTCPLDPPIYPFPKAEEPQTGERSHPSTSSSRRDPETHVISGRDTQRTRNCTCPSFVLLPPPPQLEWEWLQNGFQTHHLYLCSYSMRVEQKTSDLRRQLTAPVHLYDDHEENVRNRKHRDATTMEALKETNEVRRERATASSSDTDQLSVHADDRRHFTAPAPRLRPFVRLSVCPTETHSDEQRHGRRGMMHSKQDRTEAL